MVAAPCPAAAICVACEAACAYMFRSQIAGQPHGASEDLSPAEGSLFFGLFGICSAGHLTIK